MRIFLFLENRTPRMTAVVATSYIQDFCQYKAIISLNE